jgi:hypothetical protein
MLWVHVCIDAIGRRGRLSDVDKRGSGCKTLQDLKADYELLVLDCSGIFCVQHTVVESLRSLYTRVDPLSIY